MRPKTLVAVVLAVLMVSSGLALAAAPTVDTESTDTAKTTEINDGGTQQYNGSGDSFTEFAWSADSDNSKIEIKQDGDVIYEGSPDPYNTVSGTSYYNVTLADDGSDYDGLDVDAGANATLNVTLYNDTTADDPDTTNVSWTFANGDEMAFDDVEDTDGVEVGTGGFGETVTSLGGLLGDDEVDPARVEDKTVGITGNQTDTVMVSVESSNLTDALAETNSKAGDGLALKGTVMVNGEMVPLFTESAEIPDWVDTDETYATVSEDGTDVTVWNVQSDSDESQLDVTVVGNEAAGFWATQKTLTEYGVSRTDATLTATDAVNLDGGPNWEEV